MLSVAKIAIETKTSITVNPLPFEDRPCLRAILLFTVMLLTNRILLVDHTLLVDHIAAHRNDWRSLFAGCHTHIKRF